MPSLISIPLEQSLNRWLSGIDGACKKAFLASVCISVLAFGFEMTNLSLHYDDVNQIFIQDTILGHYLGRFGVGWLYYYTQNHYFMPFLQMAESIVLMSAYGVLVGWFWGARRAVDLALISAIMCVFPYMAQLYQYNTSMATYPAAYLLVAAAVTIAVRAKFIHVLAAAILFFMAMSIYQAAVQNAATIFVVWLLGQLLFGREEMLVARLTRATIAVLVSVLAAAIVYLGAVSMMHIEFDAYQAAEDAFTLRDALNLRLAVPAIWDGTRAFFVWPENYFPNYLKLLQLALLAAAGLCCVRLPVRVWTKAATAVLLLLGCFTPRILQLFHPEGRYHSLTLTAYAVVIAGAAMIVMRAGRNATRNVSIVLAFFLIAGYVMQCNWISTVNYLNTLAHFDTVTQILARVRSIPKANWDGKTIAVVGSYDMYNEYPLKQYEAIAPRFMDARHMEKLARLMRDEAIFIEADEKTPRILDYAATHASWPHPGSVAVLDGIGIVVFAKTPLGAR